MRNRAKCRICNTIIESFTINDLVECDCGEIAISGGSQKLDCFAGNFSNFMRVDDEGNEIVVSIQERPFTSTKPSRAELIEILDEMRKRTENLPPVALYSPATNADLASVLMLVSEIFKSES